MPTSRSTTSTARTSPRSRGEGLRLDTPGGELRVPLAATTDASAIAPVDCAVILVDSNATRAAAAVAAAVLAPDGYALTVQNGIGNVEALGAVLGSVRVLGGTTYNSAAKVAPGHVIHSNIGETTIGELDGRPSERLAELAALFKGVGLPVATSDNVIGHIWMKFVLNAAINPVSALTGLRPGEIARTAPARRLLERVLDEILAVHRGQGIRLPEANPRDLVLDHAWERYNRPSMLQHVESGRRTEIDSLDMARCLRSPPRPASPARFNEAIVLAVRAIEARAAARHASPELDVASLEAAARGGKRPLPS